MSLQTFYYFSGRDNKTFGFENETMQITCSYMEIYNTIVIEYCTPHDKQLIDIVAEHAIKLKYSSISAFSITNHEDITFYRDNGFKIMRENTFFIDDREITIYNMVKDLRA